MGRDRSLGERGGFVRFWTAETVSGFGSAITAIALQWLIVDTLGRGSDVTGMVNAARWLPYMIFGLLAGVIIDRLRRRPVLVITDLGRGLLLMAIPALALAGLLSVPSLIIFMIIFGMLSLANDAASQSILPRLVPRHQLPAANARIDQAAAVVQVAGPALGGSLVKLITAPWAVLVDAASYLASAVLTLIVRVEEPPPRRDDTAGRLRRIGREAADGLRWVYGHRMLMPLALNTNTWFICNAAANAVLVPYVYQQLGFGAAAFGLAMAAGGVGALIGALFAVRLGAAFGIGRVVVAALIGYPIGWALIALCPGNGWPGWLTFGTAQFILGLVGGAENTNSLAYRQMITPDELQGRTNAIMRSTNRAMIVVGALAGGFLAEALGDRTVLWGIAAGFAVVAIALALSPFRTARLDDVSQHG
ncbi:MFS transporter [Microlunatus elymi]|uniref:MFS transporter n=1 Tax=Microlunatus elymi TaxID=2596828 RepID=A0A516PTP4_9ACTN|nr:MFS transporter [Microlunatus elymi]QDP94564.1 MFS transporter [Microlunatus elymi]